MFFFIFSLFIVLALIPYFIRILTLFYSRTSKFSQELPVIAASTGPKKLPKISVILPVYNEEKIIVRKVQNLLDLKYPADKFELVVVDGNSRDKTVELVKSFKDNRIVLLENVSREGVTKATKDGVSVSTGDVVILTDTEALFAENALQLLAADLEHPEIGAITGVEEIVNSKDNLTTQMEQTHRKFYNMFGVSESIVYSTTYFRGEFAAIRKSLFPMNVDNDKGILDVEIAMAAIRAGFRAKCDPRIKFFGLAADKISDRNRQKIQRATLNLECILMNNDLLFLPNFYGRVIFPSTFAIHLISPILILMSVVLLPLVLMELPLTIVAPVLVVFAFSALIPKVRNVLLTFLQSQYYLFVGLLKTIFGRPKYLKQVESTRRNFDLPTMNR